MTPRVKASCDMLETSPITERADIFDFRPRLVMGVFCLPVRQLLETALFSDQVNASSAAAALGTSLK